MRLFLLIRNKKVSNRQMFQGVKLNNDNFKGDFDRMTELEIGFTTLAISCNNPKFALKTVGFLRIPEDFDDDVVFQVERESHVCL